MSLFFAFLSLLLVVLSTVGASPLSHDTPNRTLRISAKMNSTGAANIAAADKARAQAIKQAGQKGKRDGTSSFITNTFVSYTAQVGVGSPATEYTLLVDTGSSNTWVGASTSYYPTSTSHNTGNQVSVSYGFGVFVGEEYTDTVTLSPDLVIARQSIGVAQDARGFQEDGVLGVGPTGLTQGTIIDVYEVCTVTDNLYNQGTIDTKALGIYFVPPSIYDSTGELTFGGPDSYKITGGVIYVPITTMSPASAYWGIDQSISCGSSSILSWTSGIVDTGTTLILIASDAFGRYQSLTGATMDEDTGLLKISYDQYENLQSLNFNVVGDNTLVLTPNAQIWPRSLNTAIGGDSDSIYLIISDIGSDSGTGLDFINGYAFLQRYYSVYDTTNQRVGFAPTSYTYDATAN
ncbi:acid protease [Rhizopogon salebrosus TDB-379]|nr:acid protease [Rhizopogon salebrosus TDB-379]